MQGVRTATPSERRHDDRPHLVANAERAGRNIERMQRKAEHAGARFRPHFKTHNSRSVAQLFRNRGVRCITVSSVEMAEYFAADGWDDITIAFPVNLRAAERLRALAGRCRLGLLTDDPAGVERLVEAGVAGVRIWIDVDTGYHRPGVPVEAADALRRLAAAVAAAAGLELAGLLAHAGHTYRAASAAEIEAIWHDSLTGLRARAAELRELGFGVEVSVGDTPACSVVADLTGPDELRPGAFLFYDLQQLRLGACRADDLALVVACPVAARYPERGELVVQGGAVHLSLDRALDARGEPLLGAVMDVRDGWSLIDPDEARVVSLSQEHGVIRAGERLLSDIAVGDLLHVVPAHACLAANALSEASTDHHPARKASEA